MKSSYTVFLLFCQKSAESQFLNAVFKIVLRLLETNLFDFLLTKLKSTFLWLFSLNLQGFCFGKIPTQFWVWKSSILFDCRSVQKALFLLQKLFNINFINSFFACKSICGLPQKFVCGFCSNFSTLSFFCSLQGLKSMLTQESFAFETQYRVCVITLFIFPLSDFRWAAKSMLVSFLAVTRQPVFLLNTWGTML